MGAPLPIFWSSATETDVNQLMTDLADAAGALSPDEARLLAAIQRRLEVIERTRGRKAALAAAREVQRIWLQAVGEHQAAVSAGIG